MSSVVLRSIASTANQDMNPLGADPMANVDSDMRHVLDVWALMSPKPIEHCTVPEARAQPALAVALSRILQDRPDDGGVSMELRMIRGAAGDLKARVYAPSGAAAGLPMILHLHGGGFVVGDFGHDDATPRSLAKRLGAVVLSAHYRQAPEFKLPAAYDDAHAAWRWMLGNAGALGGDPTRTAIVGEGSGANLAVDLALSLRGMAAGLKHLGLITPMASTDFGLPSYLDNNLSRPLSSAAVRWLHKKATHSKADAGDPRLNLIDRTDLGGLPPVTMILAGIDPLRSEGELLADAFRRAGTWVDATTYDGVTHGFVALARIVNKAMFAQSQLLRNLSEGLK